MQVQEERYVRFLQPLKISCAISIEEMSAKSFKENILEHLRVVNGKPDLRCELFQFNLLSKQLPFSLYRTFFNYLTMAEQKIMFSLVVVFGVILVLGLVAIPTIEKGRAAHSMYNIRGSCQERCIFRTTHAEVTDIISHSSGTITKLENQLKHDIRDATDTIIKRENQVSNQGKSVVRTDGAGAGLGASGASVNIRASGGFQ
jgi:hypothetical protein